jgi:hypothetical protein
MLLYVHILSNFSECKDDNVERSDETANKKRRWRSAILFEFFSTDLHTHTKWLGLYNIDIEWIV